MNRLTTFVHKLLIALLIILFTLFYPMLISIYVFLPLFIGVMGYLLILGIERGKISYILISLLYLLNLDINLSLPLFLVSVVVLFVYTFIYPYLVHLKKCRVCIPILTVLMIDLLYLGALLAYDFVFQTENIALDDILFYSLVMDLLVAVML